MIKAIIIDDQDFNIVVLKSQLGKFFPEVQITAISTNPEEGLTLVLDQQPDLLFLDVHMPGLNGFDFLKKMQNDIQTEVIFVTAFGEFALEAYESQAAGYITKPVNAEKLILTVNKVISQINAKKKLSLLEEPPEFLPLQEGKKMALSTQKGLVFIDPETIYYCESSGNYTTFFLKGNKQIVVSKQIGQYEQLLPKQHFLRIHDRYIINLKHLKAYNRGSGGTVVLENDKELPVAVRRKESLLKHFGE